MEYIIIGLIVVLLIVLPIIIIFLIYDDDPEDSESENLFTEQALKQPEKLTQTTETQKYTEFPQYEYKFVYLNLVDTDIIKQIDNICKNFSAKGWDYYRLETSVIKHTPGCLSAIFGAQEYYTKHQYIVFRRPFKKNKDFLESSNIK